MAFYPIFEDITQANYKKALEDSRKLIQKNKGRELAEAYLYSSLLFSDLGDVDNARFYLLRSLETAIEGHFIDIVAFVNILRGLLELKSGNVSKSEIYLAKAREGEKKLSELSKFYLTYLDCSILVQKGDLSGAQGQCDKLQKLAKSVQSDFVTVESMLLVTQIHVSKNDYNSAIQVLQKSLELCQKNSYLEKEAYINYLISSIYKRINNDELNQKYLQMASQIYDKISNDLPDNLKDIYKGVKERKETVVLIKNKRFETSILETKSDVVLLNKIVRLLPSGDTTPAVIDTLYTMLDIISDYLQGSESYVYIDDVYNKKIYECSYKKGQGITPKEDIKIDQAVIESVKQKGELIAVGNGQGSTIAIPLSIQGHMRGYFYISSGKSIGDSEKIFCEVLGTHVGCVVENILLRNASAFDSLTGVFTSSFFEKLLEKEANRAARSSNKFGILLIDLDNFKLINDTYGHNWGNKVLEEASQLINSSLRSYDVTAKKNSSPGFVGRYGGDEFEVLITDVGKEQLKIIAERILKSFSEHVFEIRGEKLGLTVSIGGAIFPDDSADPKELFVMVDEALYKSKQGGKNQYFSHGISDSKKNDSPIEIDSIMLSSKGRTAIAMFIKVLEESKNMKGMLDNCLKLAVETVKAERGYVILQGEEGLEYKSIYNISEKDLEESIKISNSVLNRALSRGEKVLIKKAPKHFWAKGQESIQKLHLNSIVCVPIQSKTKIMGAMYLDSSKDEFTFAEEDLSLITIFSNRISAPLENMIELEKANKSVRNLQNTLNTLAKTYKFENIVGDGDAMQGVFKMVTTVAPTDYPVILEGETGVGKELIAKSIHFNSRRKNLPFVPLNCAAVSHTLLESELFGHMKGSFTGANESKDGLFKMADGGTLFLDEIEEMPDDMQKKLLRTLEEGKIRPVGSSDYVKVNVRVIAATNKNLEEMLKEKTLRDDLYFRLSTFVIKIPPLRERVEDIPALVRFLMNQICDEIKTPVKEITQDALAILVGYNWPGNIRELKNELRRAIVMSPSKQVTAKELSPKIYNAELRGIVYENRGRYYDDLVGAYEKYLITSSLERYEWNIRKTSRELNISRNTLRSKIQKFNIQFPEQAKKNLEDDEED